MKVSSIARSTSPQVRLSAGQREKRFSAAFCLLLLSMISASSTYSQAQPQQELVAKTLASNPKMHQAPLSHVYMNFLLHQNHLDRVAAEREMQSKVASPWRSHAQQKLGFADAEMAVVRTVAVRLEAELKDIGTRAVAIAKANRAARAEAKIEGPIQPDPRLQELTKEREDTIQREIENLKRDLGPVATAKLDHMIQNHYQEHSAYRAMLRPHTVRPAQKPLQPQLVQPQIEQPKVKP